MLVLQDLEIKGIDMKKNSQEFFSSFGHEWDRKKNEKHTKVARLKKCVKKCTTMS